MSAAKEVTRITAELADVRRQIAKLPLGKALEDAIMRETVLEKLLARSEAVAKVEREAEEVAGYYARREARLAQHRAALASDAREGEALEGRIAGIAKALNDLDDAAALAKRFDVRLSVDVPAGTIQALRSIAATLKHRGTMDPMAIEVDIASRFLSVWHSKGLPWAAEGMTLSDIEAAANFRAVGGRDAEEAGICILLDRRAAAQAGAAEDREAA